MASPSSPSVPLLVFVLVAFLSLISSTTASSEPTSSLLGAEPTLHPFLTPAPLLEHFPGPLSMSNNDTNSPDLKSSPNSQEQAVEEGAHDIDLKARQPQSGGCASGYLPCYAQGFCCAQSQVCSTDYNGQVACCPQGALCTGVLPSSGRAASTTAAQSTILGSYVLASGAAAAPTTTAQGEASNTNAIVAAGTTVAFIAGTGSGAAAVRPGSGTEALLPLSVIIVAATIGFLGLVA